MLEQVREDLREDITSQVRKEVKRRGESEIEGKYSLLVESMALVVMRNMEDYSLNKMVTLLPGTNPDPFHMLVKELGSRVCFKVRVSASQTAANTVVHKNRDATLRYIAHQPRDGVCHSDAQ